MPKAAPGAHPGQAERDPIQARLKELDLGGDALPPTLANLPATTAETVALKLAVVAQIIERADAPEAHAPILRAREQLPAL